MNAIEAIAIAGADRLQGASPLMAATGPSPLEKAAAPPRADFGEMFGQGLANVEKKLETADALVRTFALDGSVPVHRVTIALEEARLALDLALQLRTRVVEAYREIMNTQL